MPDSDPEGKDEKDWRTLARECDGAVWVDRFHAVTWNDQEDRFDFDLPTHRVATSSGPKGMAFFFKGRKVIGYAFISDEFQIQEEVRKHLREFEE